MEHTPPFYSAVDVRNAGFKLAPVDTDLFPGGWSHLTPEMLPLAVQAAMAAIEKNLPRSQKPAAGAREHPQQLLPEQFGAAAAHLLSGRLERAGGSLDKHVTEPTPIALPNGDSVTLEPLIRTKHRLVLKDFDPCTILLNNDLSAGVPGILEDLHEQFLLPPLHASWSVRRKSRHFAAYEEIAKRFGKLLGMDHWLINPMFSQCGEVDFTTDKGMECVRSEADALLTRIRRKYKEYGINEKPFVVVKADDGTGGMGLMMVRDVKDIDNLTPAARKKLAQGHAGAAVSEVLIQEGVLTHERINDAVAEPVVYMMDRYVVGGFYRVHAERSDSDSLSAPGALYVPLAFEQSAQLPQKGARPGASVPNRFYMYGVIGRLAMLAASYELEASDPDAERYDD